MVDRVSSHSKRKTTQFRGKLVWTLYSTFKTSFQPYAFYKTQLQTLFIDQLVRSRQRVPLSATLVKCIALFVPIPCGCLYQESVNPLHIDTLEVQ